MDALKQIRMDKHYASVEEQGFTCIFFHWFCCGFPTNVCDFFSKLKTPNTLKILYITKHSAHASEPFDISSVVYSHSL